MGARSANEFSKNIIKWNIDSIFLHFEDYIMLEAISMSYIREQAKFDWVLIEARGVVVKSNRAFSYLDVSSMAIG
jgi:hypothetical protein